MILSVYAEIIVSTEIQLRSDIEKVLLDDRTQILNVRKMTFDSSKEVRIRKYV